jgi:hypothetical protein
MVDNPYAPPKAVVADLETRVSSLSRPHEVTLAIRLLWFSLTLGVFNFAFAYGRVVVAASLPPGALAGALLGWTSLAWLTFYIGRGRNWARMIFLVGSVAGLPVSIWALPAMLDRSIVATTVSLAMSVLQIVALYLVFIGGGARWFRRDKASGEPERSGR